MPAPPAAAAPRTVRRLTGGRGDGAGSGRSSMGPAMLMTGIQPGRRPGLVTLMSTICKSGERKPRAHSLSWSRLIPSAPNGA
jgi:hypothetical protein